MVQVDAVRCRLDGNVYAMKTMDKAVIIRAGQVGQFRHSYTKLSVGFVPITSANVCRV